MARSYSDESGSEGGRREAYLVMVAEEAPPPPPEVRVVACCCSEKSGGVGMCRVREERGKYSGQGRPPPREMRPGVLRCLAACLREQGRRRRDSCVRWSVLRGQLVREREVGGRKGIIRSQRLALGFPVVWSKPC